MNYEKRKLNWKRDWLTLTNNSFLVLLFVFVGCKTNTYPKTSPHVVDTDLMEVREYEIVDPKTIVVKYKTTHPIEKANGMWCIPKEQVSSWKQFLIESQKQKNMDIQND